MHQNNDRFVKNIQTIGVNHPNFSIQDTNREDMRKNELLAIESIAEGVKGAYQKPLCTILHLETESMICSSVTGETENEDVNDNPGDPWYTGQNS